MFYSLRARSKIRCDLSMFAKPPGFVLTRPQAFTTEALSFVHEPLRRDMLPLWDYIIIEFNTVLRFCRDPGTALRPSCDLGLIQFDVEGTGAGGALVLLASIA